MLEGRGAAAVLVAGVRVPPSRRVCSEVVVGEVEAVALEEPLVMVPLEEPELPIDMAPLERRLEKVLGVIVGGSVTMDAQSKSDGLLVPVMDPVIVETDCDCDCEGDGDDDWAIA